jgi:tetratricopeptide (TPR) repeat protein
MLTQMNVKRAEQAWSRGEVLRQAGDLEAAKVEYQRAIRKIKDAAASEAADARQLVGRARLGLGRVCLALGSAVDAIREFEAAHQMQPEAWESLYWCGCARGWMGDYQGAEERLTVALDHNPQEGRIYLQRGYARFKDGRPEEALSDFLAAAKQGTLDDTGRLALAALRMQREDWEEAELLLRTLLEQNPHQAKVALMLGQSLEKQEKWPEAIAAYECAQGIPEAGPVACERLGVVYARLEQYELARHWLEQAVQQEQANDTVLFYQGWVSYQLDQFEACIEPWTCLCHRHPERRRLGQLVLESKYAWGCKLVQQANYEAAIPLWEAYASVRRSDEALAGALAELHLRVAAQKLQHGNLTERDEAQRHLERGWILAPEDSRFPFYLGLLELIEGDPGEAISWMKLAIACNSDDPRLRYYLALCLIEIGDVERAEKELTISRQQGKRSSWTERAERALAVLYMQERRWSDAADVLSSSEGDCPYPTQT